MTVMCAQLTHAASQNKGRLKGKTSHSPKSQERGEKTNSGKEKRKQLISSRLFTFRATCFLYRRGEKEKKKKEARRC